MGTDYRAEFFEFEGVTYLDVAGQGPLPRASARAAQAAVEWKKFPHQLPDGLYFDLPDRIRGLVARLIGGEPEEIAITAGATSGLAAVALGIDWRPEDEVLLARGEFPAHFAVWMPMAERGLLRTKIVSPRGRFITAEDFLEQIGPQTRLVSASLVRFDNAARLDAARVAAACHGVGAYLLLDVSQCVGAMAVDMRALGADFAVSAGYKWLLSPYGTGFFWVRKELIQAMRPAPFYWAALRGAREFHSLPLERVELAPGARRWDSPETASFFNLAAMEASLEFLLRVGPEKIREHNDALIQQLLERLPHDRMVAASPMDPGARGPFVCVAARRPDKTREIHAQLREAKVFVSLREGALRIAPHLFNTPSDIDRLLQILAI